MEVGDRSEVIVLMDYFSIVIRWFVEVLVQFLDVLGIAMAE